jgi:hypothetical protein
MFSGCAAAGACGSPVSSRDSKPVTYSAPQSGSSAPVSVASSTQSAHTTRSLPPSRERTVSARTRWPSTSARPSAWRASTVSPPLDRCGASSASTTARATRGSCAIALTKLAPGPSAGCARAASASG